MSTAPQTWLPGPGHRRRDTIPGTVYRVGPATGAVHRFAYPTITDVSAVGAGSLWSSLVQRAGTPVPIGRPLPGTDSWPTAIAAGHPGLWVLDFSKNMLYHPALTPARA